MYHIGQKFTSSAFSKIPIERRKLAPNCENHACFTLVSPKIKPRSEIETLGEISDEELMLEVEALRILD